MDKAHLDRVEKRLREFRIIREGSRRTYRLGVNQVSLLLYILKEVAKAAKPNQPLNKVEISPSNSDLMPHVSCYGITGCLKRLEQHGLIHRRIVQEGAFPVRYLRIKGEWWR
ncbi:MAG: hypothetical protein DRJ64_00650 [Thermoprotei archaeon]|nr:MAG: hypothetical protein DRJ64_00650 [Thermoprotei archaeon]